MSPKKRKVYSIDDLRERDRAVKRASAKAADEDKGEHGRGAAVIGALKKDTNYKRPAI